eukprot:scaffold41853_cov153-Amphora_coffeaeformis.AAC.1
MFPNQVLQPQHDALTLRYGNVFPFPVRDTGLFNHVVQVGFRCFGYDTNHILCGRITDRIGGFGGTCRSARDALKGIVGKVLKITIRIKPRTGRRRQSRKQRTTSSTGYSRTSSSLY